MTKENIVTEALVNKATGEVLEIGLQKSPDEIMLDAKQAAMALERLITENKKPPLTFKGQRYLEFAHWQTIAKFFHTTAASGEAIYVEMDGKKGFKAKGYIYDEKTGQLVGSSEAYCLNDEAQWKFKPFFQMASMAQTRAAVKACSNKYKYVAVLAGYEPTPAEEMDGVFSRPIQAPKEKEIPQVGISLDVPVGFEQETTPEGRETSEKTISKKQQGLLYARCSAAGITPDLAKIYIHEQFGLESSSDMTWQQLDKMLAWVKAYKA